MDSKKSKHKGKDMREIINRLICFLKNIPYIAENGDVYGKDNDGDGKIEKNFVNGYYRDGHYIKSHYRK